MADEKKAPEPPAKKKRPVKVIAAVAGLMVAEAVGVYVLIGMTGSGTQHAAAEIHGADQGELQQLVEIGLVEDKFQNMQTGKVWLWDTQIVLKVKKKNEALVSEELEKRSAEIMEGIAQIVRRAQHAHLREPELTTLNRQLAAYLDKALGLDPDGSSRVERVLIPRCKGFQIEQ
jgi:flagellar basal body-associated protein FliL